MIVKPLLLICYVTLVLFAYSTAVQSRHIMQKKNSVQCTPQINNSTTSGLLQLNYWLKELEKTKNNTIGNFEVSFTVVCILL